MTRGQLERANYLIDEIDRYNEEAQQIWDAKHCIFKLELEGSTTYTTIENELLEVIKTWYDKKIGALEAELKAL